MKLIMVDSKGDPIKIDPAAEGSATTAWMLEIFSQCIALQRRKALTYGEAFRSQGYMGNVARVLSKAARLKKMVWTEYVLEDNEEAVLDTMYDLINLATFFIINYRENNRWGS